MVVLMDLDQMEVVKAPVVAGNLVEEVLVGEVKEDREEISQT